MPLTAVDIPGLVKEETERLVETCNYEQLRTFCLDAKPLETIIQAVNHFLLTDCEQDKETSKKLLTQAFFKQQEEQDRQETVKDKNEAEKDRGLSDSLSQALIDLNKQINQERSRFDSLALRLQGISNQLLELNRQISQLEAVQHTHGHSEPTHHGHTGVPHHHEHNPPPHRHHGHEAVEYPEGDLYVLTSRRANAQAECRDLDLGVSSAQANLKRLTNACKKNEMKLTEISHREKEREQRALARQMRANARGDDSLDQLSAKNREELEKNILLCHKKLEEKKGDLLKEATEISYGLYIDTLLHHADVSRLGFKQKPLLLIAETMDAWLQEKEQEKQQRANLEQVVQLDKTLRQTLEKARKRLETLQQSNPELANLNERLSKNNETLRAEIDGREHVRRRVLIASAFAFLLTSVGIGIPFALPLTMIPIAAGLWPLLFIPGGVAALALGGLLITALVYTLMNHASHNQHGQQTREISQNAERAQKQTEEMAELQQKTIPQHQDELSKSAIQISEINTKVSSHEGMAAFYYQKAGQIEATTPSFAANPEILFPMPTTALYPPSAPPVHSLEVGFKS